MTISIVLCTRNRSQHLQATLETFHALKIPAEWSCELLVVDNASTDATYQVVQEFAQAFAPNSLKVRYLREPTPGKSYAYNLGLREAQGEILLFTDDDVRVPLNWIEGMVTPLLEGRCDALAGGVKIASHLQKPWMGKYHRWWMGSTDSVNAQQPEGMIGANMAFSREVLQKVPAFDVALGPGALGFEDDTLFSAQLVAAGYRLSTALDVVVEHHFEESRATREGFLDRARKGGRSLGYVAHHWEHQRFFLPHLRLLKAQLRLAALRLKHQSELRASSGVPLWEAEALSGVYFYKQYIQEQRLPFGYEKHGLVKLKPAKQG